MIVNEKKSNLLCHELQGKRRKPEIISQMRGIDVEFKGIKSNYMQATEVSRNFYTYSRLILYHIM